MNNLEFTFKVTPAQLEEHRTAVVKVAQECLVPSVFEELTITYHFHYDGFEKSLEIVDALTEIALDSEIAMEVDFDEYQKLLTDLEGSLTRFKRLRNLVNQKETLDALA